MNFLRKQFLHLYSTRWLLVFTPRNHSNVKFATANIVSFQTRSSRIFQLLFSPHYISPPNRGAQFTLLGNSLCITRLVCRNTNMLLQFKNLVSLLEISQTERQIEQKLLFSVINKLNNMKWFYKTARSLSSFWILTIPLFVFFNFVARYSRSWGHSERPFLCRIMGGPCTIG